MAENVIRKISNAISEESWNKGALRDPILDEEGETAVGIKRCLMGWIALELLNPAENEWIADIREFQAYHKAPLATRMLVEVIKDQYPERVKSVAKETALGKYSEDDPNIITSYVICFNDHGDTCYTDVTRVLDKAAVRMDEELELIELAGGRTQ